MPLPLDFLEAVLEGDVARGEAILGHRLPPAWSGSVARTLRRRAAQLRRDPTQAQWLLRAPVLRDAGLVVGHVGFHGPPDRKGMVEVGYSVLPEYRRRGFAREAVESLLDWAGRVHGITLFRASVAPRNEPSLRLVRSLGFAQTGVRWDEDDGEELVFELVRTSGTGPGGRMVPNGAIDPFVATMPRASGPGSGDGRG